MTSSCFFKFSVTCVLVNAPLFTRSIIVCSRNIEKQVAASYAWPERTSTKSSLSFICLSLKWFALVVKAGAIRRYASLFRTTLLQTNKEFANA